MKYYISFFSFLFAINISLFGQSSITDEQPILLSNPSFESFPKLSKTPSGWWDCGFQGESEVDIHPVPGGDFKVDKEPYHGGSYVGMVVRENETWEAIGQRLTGAPMKGGNCYEFTIHLGRSPLYMSLGRTETNSASSVNYATPAKLRIWGGNGYCQKAELLAESSLVINSRWLEYNFRFEPTEDCSYITFEAFYKTPTLFPYNGNLLLDNAQAIIPVPCEIEDTAVVEIAEVIPAKEDKTDSKSNVNVSPSPAAVRPPLAETKPTQQEVTIQGQRKSDLKIGSTILMKNLQFDADSMKIPPRSYESLNELYDFLAANEDLQIEIGGHTNGQPEHAYCDYISTARAESVAQFLLERGVSPNRIKSVGYGKRKPIADNRTAYGRKKNQRVEIKILGFNG